MTKSYNDPFEHVNYNAIEAACQKNGVISGLNISESSPQALTIDVAIGTAWIDDVLYTGEEIVTMNIATAHATNPRKDTIIYNIVDIHVAHDTTNLTSSADATNQATVNTLLNEIKGDYNAHRVSTTFHTMADTWNAVSSANATDLPTSLTLANEIKTDYNAHKIHGSTHPNPDVNNLVTSANATDLATCITLTNEIKGDYNDHLSAVGTPGIEVGTPGTDPIPPNIPSTAILLGVVNIPAAATLIINSDIEDGRILIVSGIHNESHLEGEYDEVTFYDRFTDEILHNNSTNRSTTSTSYVKLKEITVTESADTLRFYWAMSCSGAGIGYSSTQLRRNGVLVGSTIGCANGLTTAKEEDISGWSDGDLAQIYGIKTGDAVITTRAYNFRIYGINKVLAKPVTDCINTSGY